jgi:hypothetical protein
LSELSVSSVLIAVSGRIGKYLALANSEPSNILYCVPFMDGGEYSLNSNLIVPTKVASILSKVFFSFCFPRQETWVSSGW